MRKILISSMLTLVFILSGCASNQSKVQNTTPQGSTQSQVNTSTKQELTLDDLKKYDGQNGNPAYVAVDGIVYDVTHAKKWKNGKHENGITAGKDLTKEIASSPHGKDVLSDLPVVVV